MRKFDIITSITGFFMAFADSVPGVSGGTIAYILNRYDQLLDSINTLSSISSKKEKMSALWFLAQLLSGWIIGFIIAILLISSIIENHIYNLSSLFIGFIVFSIPYVYKEEKSYIKSNFKHIYFLIIGILVVVLTSRFSTTQINLWDDTQSFMIYVYMFLAGIIAISAMLLPGISGSTILVILGLYIPIITSIKELLHFNFEYFWYVFIFGIGVLFGLKFSSKIISKALHKHRSKIVYLIIGLMIGSIYSIIIGPTSLTNEITGVNLGLEPLNFSNFSFIYFITGIILIFTLDYIQEKFSNN